MEKPSSEPSSTDLDLTESCVQRLAADLPDVALADIIATVTRCQQDLLGQGALSALPELIERLARYRLLTTIDFEPPEPVGS